MLTWKPAKSVEIISVCGLPTLIYKILAGKIQKATLQERFLLTQVSVL